MKKIDIKKLRINKKILICVITLIIIIIIMVIVGLLLTRDKEVKKVEVSTVEDLYKQVADKNEGDKDYRYKLYGYSYDENQNVEMSVMQAYVENNKVYDIDGKEIGDYSDDTINEMLDSATVKIYYFNYKNGKYTLKSSE